MTEKEYIKVLERKIDDLMYRLVNLQQFVDLVVANLPHENGSE